MDYVIWLDSENAQIYSLTVDGVKKSHLKKTGVDHHSHSKKDHNHDSDAEHFYRDLAERLKDAEKLLIIGPGQSKNKFQTHLNSHHSGNLAKKIIGIENSDHPTDNQILAAARKFYSAYNLFNNPI